MADFAISYRRDSSHSLKYIDAALNSDHLVFALFVGEDGTIIAEQIKRPGGRVVASTQDIGAQVDAVRQKLGFFKV
ncbi:hypothetical protein OLMES_2655 [Oleiphilus messinensis]|uniref:Uncharacterized protein n=1 Tax=Oleiphilus messinensis TaxID=141451 RepID=A0A1Y0IB61_9GAMM|nr:hypothetical protein [Oleiphilus messinensis]ARU56705.1 hypothetical protein OLMES_2655 [Oleiphilus messinensis]